MLIYDKINSMPLETAFHSFLLVSSLSKQNQNIAKTRQLNMHNSISHFDLWNHLTSQKHVKVRRMDDWPQRKQKEKYPYVSNILLDKHQHCCCFYWACIQAWKKISVITNISVLRFYGYIGYIGYIGDISADILEKKYR